MRSSSNGINHYLIQISEHSCHVSRLCTVHIQTRCLLKSKQKLHYLTLAYHQYRTTDKWNQSLFIFHSCFFDTQTIITKFNIWLSFHYVINKELFQQKNIRLFVRNWPNILNSVYMWKRSFFFFFRENEMLEKFCNR